MGAVIASVMVIVIAIVSLVYCQLGVFSLPR